MTNLIELNGAADARRLLAGPKFKRLMNINPHELSDFDAALWGMKMFSIMSPPGATWREALMEKEMSGDPRLAGWWTDFRKAVGGTISEIGDKIGDWSGSAIRLFTDQEVQEGVARGAAAYASGGQSEALKGIFGNFGAGNNKLSFENFGRKIKEMFSGVPREIWIGVAGLIGILIVVKVIQNARS